jgi:acyl carrier protein
MFTQETIRSRLIQALERTFPKNCTTPLDDSVRPIGDLGLASRDGVEIAIELEELLHCKIDTPINPFVDDDKRCARTIGEMVAFLTTLCHQQGDLFNE